MSKSEVTVEHIESRFAAHRAKIAERQARIRAEEIELERDQAALVAESRAYFDGELMALREKAIVAAEQAARALAALPSKPIEPKPDLVSSLGFEEYMARCEAYPAARKAYGEAAIAAARPLAAALRGLTHEASRVRTQARNFGAGCYDGVGFIRECERKSDAVRGTVLIAFAHDVGGDLIEAIARAGEAGELTAAQAIALATMLRREPAQQAPKEPPATIWQRIQRLAAERERPRDQRSETLRDADRVMLQPEQQQRLAWERQVGIRP